MAVNEQDPIRQQFENIRRVMQEKMTSVVRAGKYVAIQEGIDNAVVDMTVIKMDRSVNGIVVESTSLLRDGRVGSVIDVRYRRGALESYSGTFLHSPFSPFGLIVKPDQLETFNSARRRGTSTLLTNVMIAIRRN